MDELNQNQTPEANAGDNAEPVLSETPIEEKDNAENSESTSDEPAAETLEAVSDTAEDATLAGENSLELHLGEPEQLDDSDLSQPVKKKSHKKLIISLIAVWVVLALLASGATYLYLFYISPGQVAKNAAVYSYTGKISEYVGSFPSEIQPTVKEVITSYHGSYETYASNLSKYLDSQVGGNAKLTSTKLLDVSYMSEKTLASYKQEFSFLNKKDVKGITATIKLTFSGKTDDLVEPIAVRCVQVNGKWYCIGLIAPVYFQ